MSKPPNSGLKGQFGVSDPQNPAAGGGGGDAGSEKQAQDFQAAFQQEQGVINGHLQYTAAHAEASAHAGFTARRDAMYPAFQGAAAKIDRKNPAQAQGEIDKVLADERALGGEVAAFRQAAEKAKNDWDAKQPKYDEGVHHIEELEAWEDKEAPALRAQADKIRTQTNERRYADASTALDALLPQLAPVYDEYVRQRDAKAKYEPARDALADRVAMATGNDRARLQPERDAVSAARDTMEASAKEKNFVQALDQVGGLTGKLEAFEVALKELDRKKKEFETANAELQGRLTPVRQSTFRTLEPKQQEIATGETALDAAAGAEDYDQAITLANELASKCEEHLAAVQKLEEGRKAYDKAWAALQPRLPTTSEPGGERIVALQQAIAAQSDKMTAAAEADDYDTALRLADELELELTDLETALAARQHYDEQWAALQLKLPQSTTGSPALADLESRIDSLRQQSETAAAADDYEQACTHLTALESTLAEYETAAAKLQENKLAYEQARAALEQHLPTSTEPGEGRLAEVQTEIQQSLADADAAEAAEDYETALEHVNALEGQLVELETLLAARDEYKAKLAQLQPRLPTSGKAAAGRLAEVQTEIETLRADAEAGAVSSDFEAALKALTELEELLTEYEDLASKREEFEQRWAEVQPQVPTATEPDASPNTLKIGDAIGQSRGAIEAVAATSGDYEGGLAEIDKLIKLLADLTEAREKEVQARANFEQKYAALKQSVESALAAQTDVKEIKAKQDDLAAKKKMLDDTVSKNDFETAQTQLADVQSSLDAYVEELGKSEVNRDLVRDMALKLNIAINRRYMASSAKINNAATAYDKALTEHKAAIAKVTAGKQLAVDIAAGVFFAALGGFAGGAVAVKVSGTVQKAFESKAVQGGVIDATKDTAKYLVRTAEKAKGKVDDPTAILTKVGGNGTELARSMGAAVNEQGAKLLGVIEHWVDVLIESDKANPSGGTVRVNLEEGNPYNSIVNDPFLAILDGICGTQADFARALWATWIQNHAYELDMACNKAGCRQVVGDNAEGFFAWWGDLTKSIQAQTGDDFGLRAKLDTARKVVQQEADERNAHGWQTQEPPF